jgi:hypothetical protein
MVTEVLRNQNEKENPALLGEKGGAGERLFALFTFRG